MINKTKVLVVDDSAVVREFMRSLLGEQPDLEVAGTAADPIIAQKKIAKLQPDVIILDVEMPRMDGLTFLRRLMATDPMPVVMFSKVTHSGAEATLEALRLGAVEVVGKPTHNLQGNLPQLKQEIITKVRAAARARIARHERPPRAEPAEGEAQAVPRIAACPSFEAGEELVVVLGASTGGTVALEQVLCALPPDSPPLALVQHLPSQFTRSFARRLNDNAAIEIVQAEDFMPLTPGRAAVSPGTAICSCKETGAVITCASSRGPG